MDFRVVGVLNNDVSEKVIDVAVEDKTSKQPGVVRLLQPAFSFDLAKKIIENTDDSIAQVEMILKNTKYSQWNLSLTPQAGRVNMEVIYPAVEKDFKKYEKIQYRYSIETAKFYEETIRPYILSLPKNEIEWVRNIIESKAEQDKVIIQNDYFVTVPDMKWDAISSPKDVYAVSIVKQSDLLSLRDLRGSHLQLLKDWKEINSKVITEKYGVEKSKLLFVLHYYPSFFHLHLHICSIDLPHSRHNLISGRAHHLDEVISNLEMNSDYYKTSSLPVIVFRDFVQIYEKEGLN